MEKVIRKTPLKKLTKQDRVFVSKVVQTGKLTKSVQESYKIKDPKYASVKAQRLIAKDSIVEAIEVERLSLKQAFDKEGITSEKVAERVNRLLKDKDGNIVDKGLKHAMNVFGVTDTEDKPKISNTYNFIFNADTQKEIKEMEDKIKNRLIQNHGEKSN